MSKQVADLNDYEKARRRGNARHPSQRRRTCQIVLPDEVKVSNARGSFFAVADVSDRVRPGVVARTKGRWPGHAKRGANVNATVDDRDSDMGSGAVYHDNRVRVSKDCMNRP